MPNKKLVIPNDLKIGEDEFASVDSPEKRRFLACFVNGGYTIYHAAAMAKVSYQTARKWADQPFMDALQFAKDIVKDKLERELIRRAMEGYDGTKKYDGDLLKIFLRKLDPDYRERSSVDVAVTVDVTAEKLRLGRERVRAAMLNSRPEAPAIEAEVIASR